MSSNVVDSKVVELSLENESFESNAKQSLSTLEKLKLALKFDNASKGFDDIKDSIKNVNVDTVTKGVDTLRGSLLSLKDVAVFSIIADEAVKAKNAVEGFIKSVSIDQVSAGWDKYAEKTRAVQTIMSATAKDWDDQAAQMEYVNEQLARLNWFSDETSYSFTDMVGNVGKFTSNNIQLENAVTAMEGIATWAGISGASTQEASRAMYNLSQAIAVGSVKLMDWKSIENANMATAQFKQTAIDTAVELGTLTKVSDDLYRTLAGHDVSVANFNSNLSDAWFTSDVLLTSLDKYGGFTTRLSEIMEDLGADVLTSDVVKFVEEFKNGTVDLIEASNELGISVPATKKILEELGSETYDLGFKAFQAAQQAVTFTDAIESVKDAVSTGFMNTFELLFGDFLEAKQLWTELANDLWDVFASGITETNAKLEEAFSYSTAIDWSDWHQLEESGIASPKFMEAIRRSAREHGVYVDMMADDQTWLKTVMDRGLLTVDDLQNAYKEAFGGHEVDQDILSKVESIKETDESFQELLKTAEKFGAEDVASIIFGNGKVENAELESALDGMLKSLGLSQDEGEKLVDVLNSLGYFGGEISDEFANMTDAQLKRMGLEDEEIAQIRAAKASGKELDEVIQGVLDNHKSGKELWTESLYNSMEAVLALFEEVSAAWEDVFPETSASSIHGFLQDLNSFTGSLSENIRNSDTLKNVLHGLFSTINGIIGAVRSMGKNLIVGGLAQQFIKIAFGAGKALTAIAGMGKKILLTAALGGIIRGLGIDFGAIIGKVSGAIGKIIDFVNANKLVSRSIGIVKSAFTGVGQLIKSGFTTAFEKASNIGGKAAGKFKSAFESMSKGIGPWVTGTVSKIEGFIEKVKSVGGLSFDNIGKVFSDFKNMMLEQFSKFPGAEKFKSAFKEMGNNIKANLRAVGIDVDKVSEFFTNFGTNATKAFNFLKTGVLGGGQALLNFFNSIRSSEAVQNIASKFQNGFSQFFSSIGPFVSGAVGKVQEFIGKVKDLGGLKLANLGKIFGAFKTSILDYFANFKGFDGFKDAIATTFGNLKTVAMDKIGDLWVTIRKFFQGTPVDSVLAKVQEAFNKISAFFSNFSFANAAAAVGGKVTDFWTSLRDKFKDTPFDGILQGIQDSVKHVLDNLTPIFSGAVSPSEIIGALGDKFTSIKNWFAEKFDTILDGVGTIDFEGIKTKVLDFFDGIKAKLSESGIEIPKSLWDIPDFFSKVKDAISGFSFKELFDGFFGAKEGASDAQQDAEELNTIAGTFKDDLIGAFEVIGTALDFVKDHIGVIVVGAVIFKIIKSTIGHIREHMDAINKELKARAFKERGEGFAAIGLGILLVAAGIWVLSDAVMKLSEYDSDQLSEGLWTIFKMVAMFAGLAVVVGIFQPAGDALKGLALVIAAIAASLFVLSFVPEDKLEKAKSTILWIVGITAVLSAVTGIFKPSEKALWAMAGLIAVMSICFGALASIDNADKVAEIAKSIGIAILAISAAMFILGMIGKLGGVIAPGLAALGIFIVAITVIGGLIGAFVSDGLKEKVFRGIDMISELFGKIADIFITIASKVGEVIGALIGCGIDELFSNLGELADNIKEFNEHIKGIRMISFDEFVAVLEALALVLVTDVVGFISGCASFVTENVTGMTAVEQVGDDLQKLADALVYWDQQMSEIGSLTVPGLDIAALGVVDLFANVLGFVDACLGFVTKMLVGQMPVEIVANDIKLIADALHDWETKMGDIKGIHVPAFDLAVLGVVDLFANVLGFATSCLEFVGKFLIGKGPIQKVTEDLGAISKAISDWQTEMDKLGPGGITLDSEGLKELGIALLIANTEGFVTSIEDAVGEFLTGKKPMDDLSENITKLGTALTSWQTSMDEMGALTVPKKEIDDLIEAIKAVPSKDLWDAIGEFFTGSDALDDFVTNTGKLGDALSGFNERTKDIKNTKRLGVIVGFASEFADIGTKFMSATLYEGFNFFSNNLEIFGENLAKISTNSDINMDNLSAISEASGLLGGAMSVFSDTSLKGLDVTDETIVTTFCDNLQKVVDVINGSSGIDTSGVSKVSDSIDELSKSSIKGAGKTLEQANQQLESANKAASNAASGASDSFAQGIDASAISGAVGDAVNSAISAIDVSGFAAKGTEIVRALASAIANAGGVTNAVTSIISEARNSIDDSKFTSAGINLSRGLAIGIGIGKAVAVESARAMAQAALNAIKATFDSHSPSRETMKIGGWFVDGFAIGVDRRSAIATRSVKDMGNDVLGSLKGAVNGISAMLTEDIAGDPVIRPVLDLTDIQNGAGQLSDMLNMSVPIPVTGQMNAINENVNGYVRTTNDDIVAALSDLKGALGGSSGNTYVIDGITYDDGSNITDAVRSLVRAANVGRRV